MCYPAIHVPKMFMEKLLDLSSNGTKTKLLLLSVPSKSNRTSPTKNVYFSGISTQYQQNVLSFCSFAFLEVVSGHEQKKDMSTSCFLHSYFLGIHWMRASDEQVDESQTDYCRVCFAPYGVVYKVFWIFFPQNKNSFPDIFLLSVTVAK